MSAEEPIPVDQQLEAESFWDNLDESSQQESMGDTISESSFVRPPQKKSTCGFPECPNLGIVWCVCTPGVLSCFTHYNQHVLESSVRSHKRVLASEAVKYTFEDSRKELPKQDNELSFQEKCSLEFPVPKQPNENTRSTEFCFNEQRKIEFSESEEINSIEKNSQSLSPCVQKYSERAQEPSILDSEIEAIYAKKPIHISIPEPQRTGFEVNLRREKTQVNPKQFRITGRDISFEEALESYNSAQLRSVGRLWKKSPFLSLCCMSKPSPLTDEVRESIERLLAFGELSFDKEESFHRDLLATVLRRLSLGELALSVPLEFFTENSEMQFTLEDSLSNKGSVLTLLLVLFLDAYFHTETGKIWALIQDHPFPYPFFVFLLKMTKQFLRFAQQGKLNSHLSGDGQTLEQLFFFYGGLIFKWLEFYGEAKSVKSATRKTMSFAGSSVHSVLQIAHSFYTGS